MNHSELSLFNGTVQIIGVFHFIRTAFRNRIEQGNNNAKNLSKWFHRIPRQIQKNTGPSDLSIPVHWNKFIQIKKHKNLKNYFHYLMLKFQKRNLFYKFTDTAFRKTLYQSKNQQLIRYSFRPDHQNWYEAKFAGFYFGISVCKFFSRLVDLDREEDSQFKILADELRAGLKTTY
ncbi:PF07600 family protein [Leptospira weilii serovar Topaz str. LT2116]|uniref:PF07600 family protein n=1 Tax=Leptospira weilii serovar Topaz str. LT2116 TaxID=1088540 RepID=M3GVZ8_9LEPT|nr:PF07600 family protein [Leptospira weilii serovar Topaz str. LT2116]